MPEMNRQVLLKRRPNGMPVPDDFVIIEGPLLYRGQCQARPDDRMLSPVCALANDATRGSRFSSRLAGSHLMMG